MCRTKVTSKKKALFLTVLAQGGNVSKACEAADIARRTVYEYRDRDPDFAAEWDEAQEQYVNKLEEEADRRAHDGVENPVYQGGELVGFKREYSDTLLIFRLKALKPDKYRENVRQEITGKDGGPIETTVNITVDGEPLEDDGDKPKHQ
jgi:hypothetical protein